MTSNVREQVVAIIAEQAFLEPSDVKSESTLEDLGIDSMGLVEAVFSIEETFEIQVPFNANEPGESDFDITTVDAIVKGVEGLVQAKA